ncbi:MAG: M20/M25/M40 family metallo-hydrolase [Xanthomonadales bacterium]|nr:M20/M25/M40 family metallo-hydrolase [Xanthomonadales bacterium]
MTHFLATTLQHLQALVAFDTRNPPRAIGTGGIFDYLVRHLPGFECTITDHGAGAVSLFALRGAPRILFNVHLDTVPDSPGWSVNPFELRVSADRAIGLGACDIKGAAAALLAAADEGRGDAAFLFTSDEEANEARCIAAFLAESSASGMGNQESTRPGSAGSSPQPLAAGARDFDVVIVAEPTRGAAALAHRGISSVRMRFAGRAGHASGAQALADSALHQAVRWGSRALAQVDALAGERFDTLSGLRFNIGRIEGGIKANVIAPAAELRFNFRPLPSMHTDGLLAGFRALAEPPPAEFDETFRGPPLPAGAAAEAARRRLAARTAAENLGLTVGPAVDFWTEASLFSEAGFTSFVYGPGDIAQAHTADEWVALDELRRYAESVQRIINP